MPFITFVVLCAEIALLIKLGQAVGGGSVLIEILLTGGLGILLLRMAGRSVFEPARLLELLMRSPTRNLVKSLGLLFLGGLLLLIPGLLSDAVGLVLVFRFFLQGGRTPRGRPDDPNTIDVDFQVHDDAPRE
jgi:UPF0716 family protein affecting phage T7 exclusion